MIRSRSIESLPVSSRLTFLLCRLSTIVAALLLEQREVVAHAQLVLEPTPHPVPSGLPSVLHLLGHPPFWDAAPFLQRGETEAQTNEKENDRSDKDEEQQYLHEAPPSRLSSVVITNST